MKKVFTSALGLAAVMSVAPAFAETTTVTTKNEWTAVMDAARTADQVDTILFKPADGKMINIGNWTQKAEAQRGRIVIIGQPNEAGELPDMHIGWNFSANAEADHYSIEIYNCKITYRADATATSGQVFYDNKVGTYIDEFIIDHCEITNIPRTFYRSVPTDPDADGNIVYGRVGIFSITNCDAHYMNISEGNTWAFIVMGTPFDELTIKNNTFYDMPYQKQFMSMSYINKDFVESADGIITVENNDFFLATNQTYPFFQFDNTIGQMSQYYFNNNVFMRPTWEGDYINVRPVDENGDPRLQQIARISYGIVEAKNNIIDETFRESDPETGWSKDVYLDEDGEGGDGIWDTEPGILPETAGFTWDDMPFAQEGNFIRAKEFGNPNHIGVIPVKTTVNVSAEGMKAASVTISPAKDAYFVGDEVTLTVNAHNSKYRQFGNFVKWQDGNTENPRKVILGETNDFIATVEENIKGVLTVFELESDQSGNYEFVSDFQAADQYKATLVMMVDTVGNGEYHQVISKEGNFNNRFQYRNNKFGEDAVEDQMCIVSRRTPAYARLAGHMDYIQIALSTKDAAGLAFSCFVGTDNFAFTKQNADYSIDGGATWKNFATVDLQLRELDRDGTHWIYGDWTELKGELPAEAEGLDQLLIRVISDPTSEPIVNPASGELDLTAVDNFEYTGHILITASGASGIESIRGDKMQGEAAIYDLQGRRVLTVVPGQLYIQGGKRFIQK